MQPASTNLDTNILSRQHRRTTTAAITMLNKETNLRGDVRLSALARIRRAKQPNREARRIIDIYKRDKVKGIAEDADGKHDLGRLVVKAMENLASCIRQTHQPS